MKKFINFQFEILDSPYLDGGKPIANQSAEVKLFAQRLGWKEQAPDPYAPEYCQFVILPSGTSEAEVERISAECAARGQGCITEDLLSPGDKEVIEAENARRAAAYEMACKIAEQPRFAVEDTVASQILQAYFSARLSEVPPKFHPLFSQELQDAYEIA